VFNYIVYDFDEQHDTSSIPKLPVCSHLSHNIYHVLAFPNRINGTTAKFAFIQSEKEFVLTDKTRQYYTSLRQRELCRCKLATSELRVCKQDLPVEIVHSVTDCETRLLQFSTSIPESCLQRVVALKDSLWTQLGDNVWLYEAPHSKHMATICPGQDPTDVTINGLGKLTFRKPSPYVENRLGNQKIRGGARP
jgi:hypothetical protein